MKNFIPSFLDRLFVVAGALFFLQLPLFMTHYQHQLQGHVDELAWQVQHMEKAAAMGNKSLEDYIKKFVKNQDREIASQGAMMQKIHHRWKYLSEAFEALDKATLLSRPWHFVRTFQKDVALSTLHSFRPGLPLTVEALFYALIGMMAGFCLFIGVKKNIPFIKRQVD